MYMYFSQRVHFIMNIRNKKFKNSKALYWANLYSSEWCFLCKSMSKFAFTVQELYSFFVSSDVFHPNTLVIFKDQWQWGRSTMISEVALFTASCSNCNDQKSGNSTSPKVKTLFKWEIWPHPIFNRMERSSLILADVNPPKRFKGGSLSLKVKDRTDWMAIRPRNGKNWVRVPWLTPTWIVF